MPKSRRQPGRHTGRLTGLHRKSRLAGPKRIAREEMQVRTAGTDWQWSRKYRVWDANRKVFVFPENWLEPSQVLPGAFLLALRDVAAGVRAHCAGPAQLGRTRTEARGKNVPVLFTGKNRAGVLIAAQTLARYLEMDLYHIGLGQVVGKYISETEKNVSRVFEAAEKGAVLLFDEAEALLRQRTEVKDSHDRYANVAINYLLKRLERFGNPAIVSTKGSRRLDRAFGRRFPCVIRVPPPGKRRGGRSSAR